MVKGGRGGKLSHERCGNHTLPIDSNVVISFSIALSQLSWWRWTLLRMKTLSPGLYSDVCTSAVHHIYLCGSSQVIIDKIRAVNSCEILIYIVALVILHAGVL